VKTHTSAFLRFIMCSVLRAHGLCDSALRTIYRSVVFVKLLYASSSWKGFANATDRNKIQSFINNSKRNGYCSPDLPAFSNSCTSIKVNLFNKKYRISCTTSIGGGAYDARRLVPPQNLGPGGTLWNVPPQNFSNHNAVRPRV